MLLVADLHLTDNPSEEYRWAIFGELRKAFAGHHCDIIIAGDLCDRKDRHSGELVNRLVKELTGLRDFMWETMGGPYGEIHIIMGNHDAPLKGVPFWSFFDHIEGIHFYTEPAAHDNGELLFLPFTPNPAEAWADLDLAAYRCLIMHQPLVGARGANGRALAKGSPMPVFQKWQKLYSGDIHGPQKVGRVEYIGSPHPVAFDENHLFRIVHLDKNYRNDDSITLRPLQRHILDISYDDLAAFDAHAGWAATKPGDQVKIRCRMPLALIKEWPQTKAHLEACAKRDELQIFSLEPIVEAGDQGDADIIEPWGGGEAPDVVLGAFAEQEGIKGKLLQAGQRLLVRAMTEGS